MVRHEKARQICELGRIAVAPEGIFGRGLVTAACPLLWIELRRRARGRERAWRDGYEAYAFRPPFHGQALRHGEHAGLRHCRWHRIGSAGNGGGGKNAEHDTWASLRNPALPGGKRAIQGAM